MFWKSKKPVNEELKSEEYELLNKKFVAMVADIDIITNRIGVIDQIARGNRVKIGKICRDEVFKENEDNLKDEPKYI